jgi:predicted hydrocarbon binding protein
MHGVIFHEMKSYAQTRLGARGWESLLEKAGLGPRIYLAFRDYPDAEVTALVDAVSRMTGQPPRQVLEEFGELIGPSLLRKYAVLIEPQWTVLDVVEKVERIHEQVAKDTNSRPPRIFCHRPARDRVQVTYASPHKLCGLGIGVIRGMARHLGQSVAVQERRCMLQGATRCELEVSLLA